MASKPNKIKRSWVVERKPFERENNNDAFYNSWAWRKVRKSFLSKNPLCKHCDEKGITEVATVVDHILPINRGGDKLNEDNFQSLCESCHNKKSSSESRGYGV
jgi:5-methylcytosine-specific restriction endonuclease McrA